MFKLNKQGFTLVELLAVIVVLAIIMVIAIPNILGIIDNTRKDSFIATAKNVIDAAKTRIASDSSISVPIGTTDAIVFTVNSANATTLKLDSMSKDADGGAYGANTYVVVYNNGTKLVYFVTIDGSVRDLNYASETTLSDTTTARAAIGANGTATAVGLTTGVKALNAFATGSAAITVGTVY